MWKKYSGRITGIRLTGDSKVPRTRWWNHLYLLLFVWDEITVLQVPDGAMPYRVGYVDGFGDAKCNTRLYLTRRFAVRHGRESCLFFAVMPDGTEIPLTVIKRATIETLPPDVPLV
jgi:hypothetical protein